MRYSVKAQYSLELDGPAKNAAGFVDRITIRVVREGRQEVRERGIHTPATAAFIVSDLLEGSDREHVIALILNTKNRIIGVNVVSIGSVNECIVSPREVFKPALILGATAVLLVHNHPSGDATPSPEDYAVTERLKNAGTILGIELIDHVVIGRPGEYTSIRESGRLTW